MHKSCQKVSLLVSESQDRELTKKEKVLLKVHLFMCHGCRLFCDKMMFLRKATVILSKKIEEGEEIGEGLSLACAKRIKAEIQSKIRNE